MDPDLFQIAAALQYFVLDVFSDVRLAGNALAVVINPGWLTTENMQAIARETNLSETTFVERRDAAIERSEGALVRIFTTEEELPFAGHPTLGTASLLRVIAPEIVVDGTIKLALKVGPIPVRFGPEQDGSRDSYDSKPWPMRGEMTQRDPEFGEVLDPDAVAGLIGLSIEDIDTSISIQIVSTGTAFAIVVLRSGEALSRLHVQQQEAAAFLRPRGARWFYVLGPEVSNAGAARGEALEPDRWRARMQFNGGEDPATGSAAGCAISHLVRAGCVASGQLIHLLQGVEMKRRSEIRVSARLIRNETTQESSISDVRVAGSTILVASGHLFLP